MHSKQKAQRVLKNERGRREMRKKGKAVKKLGHYVRYLISGPLGVLAGVLG